ncbi:GTP-binding protein [Humisphaera borealis]|uniref:CobW/HypB/UreG nucleotide-binding domain-containing protein n=1 Tax=Humisphaera borealis TaxID=2807512 RepID=A0A7M2WUU8_9BACT|nr:GTP-binding protein [Humisphaera borealis]QOV88962.1 hypothetical protein IPV69_22475 [Humisphaera borealis]
MVRIVGPPGAGKTALVEASLRRFKGKRRVSVIVVNPAADRDANLLRPLGAGAIPIIAAVPDTAAVARAVESIDPETVDLILLEACGGITPFPDTGETAVVAVLGVSGGDDKAAEYASLVSRAELVLLTKTDLLAFIRFSSAQFNSDVRRLNPSAPVLEVSTINTHGLDEWTNWLDNKISAARSRHRDSSACGPELFVG